MGIKKYSLQWLRDWSGSLSELEFYLLTDTLQGI